MATSTSVRGKSNRNQSQFPQGGLRHGSIRTVRPAGDVDERKWEPVIEALSAAKRETDVIGWFESLATIGVILPETDASDPAVATEMVSRVRQELAARVDADAPISCITQIHSYSGRFDGRETHPADPLSCDRPARWWSVAKRVIDVMSASSSGCLDLWTRCVHFARLVIASSSPRIRPVWRVVR